MARKKNKITSEDSPQIYVADKKGGEIPSEKKGKFVVLTNEEKKYFSNAKDAEKYAKKVGGYWFENGGEIQSLHSIMQEGGEFLEPAYDKVFEEIYKKYNEKDYFSVKSEIDTQLGNWKRAMANGDKNAKNYTEEKIIEIVKANSKARAYMTYEALKNAIESGDIQYLKSRVRYDQKYTKDLYEAITKEKLPSSNKELTAYFDSKTFDKGGSVSCNECDKSMESGGTTSGTTWGNDLLDYILPTE